MPLTTIYGDGTRVIGSGTVISQGLHPTVMEYISIMSSNGGYTMNFNEIDAINNMVLALVANGIWTKLKAIYPVLGGTAATHKFNLKDPRDTDAAFRLSFLGGGWTHNSNGMTPNGTTSYANTFLIPSTALTLNNTHLSYYTGTTTVGNAQRDIAAFTDGGIPSYSLGTNTNQLISDCYYLTVNRLTATMTNGSGLICGSRTSITVHKAFRNGAQIGNTDTVSTAGQVLPNIALFIGAANIAPSGAVVTGFSNKNYRLVTIGDGLTDVEAAALYSIVQAYQQKLGRAV